MAFPEYLGRISNKQETIGDRDQTHECVHVAADVPLA